MVTTDRETWGTRLGFIFAAIGSAVGLGNIWRFPYLTANNGGAAFLIIYLIAVIIIGLPALYTEFAIGRSTRQNTIDAFRSSGGSIWTIAGVLTLLAPVVILGYYSIVGGWTLRYIFASVTGALSQNPSAYFDAISVGTDALFFHALFMAIVIIIVAFGIERGIELATRFMVPAIIILLTGIAIWAATLPGVGGGYTFYLNPDWDVIVSNLGSIIPAAVGQALFTLSLGQGIMITYSSYLGEDHDLLIDGFSITFVNTIIGILAGFTVFPLLAAQNITPGSGGSSAIFISLVNAFQVLPFGRILAVVFFVVMALAAISSAIGTFEAPVSYLVDNISADRPVIAVVFGVGIFLIGIPAALNHNIFLIYDSFSGSILLPLAASFAVFLVGWRLGPDAVEEIQRGAGSLQRLAPIWLWFVRTVVLVAVVGTLILSVVGLF